MTNLVLVYYHYNPSLVAAIIFLVLFLLTTLLHFYQLLRTRTWYFIPFLIGGFFEWIGYIGRIVSSQQTPNWTLTPYFVQILLLLLAPVLFAASIYMELARIILLADGEAHSLVRPKRLTMIFVLGDVLSFFLQAGGGGLMSKATNGENLSSVKAGQDIIIGGLFLQILFFGCFVLVAVLFQIRINKTPTPQSDVNRSALRKHLIALYAASILILIRSVFRVVEFIQGNDGYILGHEWFLYVFDGILMLSVMFIFNVVHPSEIKALLHGGKASRRGLKLYEIPVSR